MIDLGTIRAMAQERAYMAAQNDDEPMVLWEGDDPFKIPNLGALVPHGWKLLRAFFVDASGFGRPGEPAMTVNEYHDSVVPGRGYAIIQAGQFQVHVGEFCRIGEEPDEVNLDGHAIFPPDAFAREAEEFADYARARADSEDCWIAACEIAGVDDPYEAMTGGLGEHIMAESVEDALKMLEDWGMYDPVIWKHGAEGCYADGAFGQHHIREKLIELLEEIDPDHDMIEALRGPAPDDFSDEDEAIEALQERTASGLVWELDGGDLILRLTDSVDPDQLEITDA